jgi:hypothetical protein
MDGNFRPSYVRGQIKAGLIDDNIDDFMLVQTMLEVNMLEE